MAAPFRDTFGHWAQAYIETLSAQGVLNGFPDGTFRPNEPVTRAQFATIVNTAFRLRNTSGTFIGFRDVPPHPLGSQRHLDGSSQQLGGRLSRWHLPP